MKLSKHSNIIFVGLALILSLVSFSGVVNHLPSEVVKTALLVGDYNDNTRFAISYQNVIKDHTVSFTIFTAFTFAEFQNNYSLKALSAFKSYTYQTLGLSAAQLHTQHYALSTHQTLYNTIV